MRLDYLAFGAHPDDVEIGMAGTLARAAAEGKWTGIADLTRAELSSNGTPENRQREAEASARLLGLKVRENLAFPDRGITGSREQLEKVVSLIRRYRPRVVFAPYWSDRHPDHERTSELVREAVFTAGIGKFEDPLGLSPHKAEAVYYYFINSHAEPSVLVDVSSFYVLKEEALSAYRSQFFAGEGSVMTPLNQGFLEMVRARDRWFGQQAGVQFAEGFVKRGPVLLMP